MHRREGALAVGVKARRRVRRDDIGQIATAFRRFLGRRGDRCSANGGAELASSSLAEVNKLLIESERRLTNSEAARFWPIYDEYRAEIHKLGGGAGRKAALTCWAN